MADRETAPKRRHCRLSELKADPAVCDLKGLLPTSENEFAAPSSSSDFNRPYSERPLNFRQLYEPNHLAMLAALRIALGFQRVIPASLSDGLQSDAC